MKLKNVFISTYTFIYNGIRTNNSGPVLPLLDFFRPRTEKLYILEQPLPGSDSLDTCLTIYTNGEERTKLRKNFFFSRMGRRRLDSNVTYLRLKLRDLLSNLYFFLSNFGQFRKDRVNLYIGLESINACIGVIMRRLGLVDKVVYYIFDWSPNRYSNPLINKLYIWLDKFATYYSDYTWNITYTIGEARKKLLGYNEARMSPQLYVPYSVSFFEKKVLPDDKVDTDLVIYSGGLIDENGPKLLIDAYKIVVEKHPESRLLVIGGNGAEYELRDYIRRHSLDKNVEITGYIADVEEVIQLQCKGAIGVAPYPFIKGSRKPYGDVIKIRMYIACGLVTVTTPVPPVSREVFEEKLGYRTVDDSPEAIAAGICFFLSDKRRLMEYRKNVIEKARKSDWVSNYTKTLTLMGYEPKILSSSILMQKTGS